MLESKVFKGHILLLFEAVLVFPGATTVVMHSVVLLQKLIKDQGGCASLGWKPTAVMQIHFSLSHALLFHPCITNTRLEKMNKNYHWTSQELLVQSRYGSEGGSL